jgi:microcystin-dependent protein
MSTPAENWSTTSVPVPVNSGRGIVSNFSARRLEGVGVFQRHPLGSSALLVPPGCISAYAGASAPGGWLICNGQQVDRQIYANLFSVIGTIYGNGDGSTTFNVPNLKGRHIMGVDSTASEFDVLGETGGEKKHLLTVDEMPTHSHNVIDPGHAHGITDPGHQHGYSNNSGDQNVNTLTTQNDAADQIEYPQLTSINTTGITINTNTTGITLGSTGGNQSHYVLDPFMAMHYIIKV